MSLELVAVPRCWTPCPSSPKTRFLGHAELAFAEAGFDMFGGIAYHSDLESANQGGAVHSYSGDESLLHEIGENRAQANLDDAPARFPPLLCGCTLQKFCFRGSLSKSSEY